MKVDLGDMHLGNSASFSAVTNVNISLLNSTIPYHDLLSSKLLKMSRNVKKRLFKTLVLLSLMNTAFNSG